MVASASDGAARLEQAAQIVAAYANLLSRFNQMQTDLVDFDSGDHVEVAVEDPEFGAQLLGIANSLIGALTPLLNPPRMR